MKSRSNEEEDIVRELDELRKDPVRWEKFMAVQAEKALKRWPGRKTR